MSASATHVLAGPDHLAAVLPLAVQDKQGAARTGAAWGLGHGAGVVALGALGQVLQGHVPLQGLSDTAELAVGLLLVFVGLRTLLRSRLLTVHSHPHEGAAGHPHLHLVDPTVHDPEHARRSSHKGHSHSAFGFGLLHGVAGGSHLLAALPSLALAPAGAALYLGCYLVAAVCAMSLFAAGAGWLVPLRHMQKAMALSGALSVVVGVFWVGTGV